MAGVLESLMYLQGDVVVVVVDGGGGGGGNRYKI